jgi:hypothetical protein
MGSSAFAKDERRAYGFSHAAERRRCDVATQSTVASEQVGHAGTTSVVPARVGPVGWRGAGRLPILHFIDA